MGTFLQKPKTEKETDQGEGNGIMYAVSAMQGWRTEMEDAHICNTKVPFGKDYSIFGVFDGHAGRKVAVFCSENLIKCIMNCIMKGSKSKKIDISADVEQLGQCMKEGFLSLDSSLLEDPLWSSRKDRSGSTAIVAMVTPGHIIFANCGDSRGILCRGGKVEFASQDHKPSNEAEKKRIEEAGGTVMMQRVNGSLAVSRALGDFDYKTVSELGPCNQLVSPEPEITIFERFEEEDQFLLLACDGVFDVMSNEEVVKFVLRKLEFMDDLTQICSDLIDTCLNKNSRDNMSVILVTFTRAPKVTEEGKVKNEKLQSEANKVIEAKIAEMADEAADPLELEIRQVLDQLEKTVPEEYEMYSNSKMTMISELLDEHRKRKFGIVDDDFSTEYTDPTDPVHTSSGLDFSIQQESFEVFDRNLSEYSGIEAMVTGALPAVTDDQGPSHESDAPTTQEGSEPPPNNMEQS